MLRFLFSAELSIDYSSACLFLLGRCFLSDYPNSHFRSLTSCRFVHIHVLFDEIRSEVGFTSCNLPKIWDLFDMLNVSRN